MSNDFTKQYFISEVIDDFVAKNGTSDASDWKPIVPYLVDEVLVPDDQWFAHQQSNGLQFTQDTARAKVILQDCMSAILARGLLSDTSTEVDEKVREVIEEIIRKERNCPFPFHFC